MRPHRHAEAHKWEFFIVLEGKIDLLVFDDEGAYIATREQDFAAWSPAENTDRAAEYVERMRLAQVGDSLTS